MIAAAVLATAAPSPAAAWAGRVTWTTWMRAGPGLQYTVTDEVDQDTVVQVIGCENGWCRMIWQDGTGYIQADMLAQTAPAQIRPGPSGSCFDATEAGYGKGDRTRFCPSAAAGK